MSSMISFFLGFYVDNSDGKVRFNKVAISSLVHQYAIDFEF